MGLKNRFFVHEITIGIRSLPLNYMINDFNKFCELICLSRDLYCFFRPKSRLAISVSVGTI